MSERTSQQIVDDANELARKFYAAMGYVRPEGFRFDQATHPQEVTCWRMATEAYEFIEGTDVEDAIIDLEDEEVSP